jgi:DNA modification methylase
MEDTIGEYINRLVEVFREVRRVLRNDGVLWLNLGDGYVSDSWGGGGYPGENDKKFVGKQTWETRLKARRKRVAPKELKRKNLIGMPWRLALALQSDGWYLRSDTIWHKPNALPNSVKDHPHTCHDYLFLLAKKPRYYFDMDSIKDPVTGNAHPRGDGVNPKARSDVERAFNRRRRVMPEPRQKPEYQIKAKDHPEECRAEASSRMGRYPGWRKNESRQNESFSGAVNDLVEMRNVRTVWTIPTQPRPEKHYASFPDELARRAILSGCPPGGTVLDPFVGRGTTVIVALRNQRSGIGIDLSPEYCEMARKNIIDDAPLFNHGLEAQR